MAVKRLRLAPLLKKATKMAASKKKHPVFSITSPDPYVWSDWVYVVIQ
ncbi:MAG: hypothetical protein ABR968_07975 [Bacteroidales bacterium]